MKSFTEWVRDYFKESISNEDYDWMYIPHKNQIIRFDEFGEIDEGSHNWVQFIYMNKYTQYVRDNESVGKKLDRILDILEKR